MKAFLKPVLPESSTAYRYVYIANVLATVLSVFTLILFGILLILFGWRPTSGIIIAVAMLFFVTVLLNQSGYTKAGRLFLCLMPVYSTLFISIYGKLEASSFTYVLYFDSRFILLAVMVLPAVVFPTRERFSIFICLLSSAFAIFMFDPLHNWLGVGYYQKGFDAPSYYYVNYVAAVCFFLIFSAMWVMKVVQERAEGKTRSLLFEKEQWNKEYVLKIEELKALSARLESNNEEIRQQKEEMTAVRDLLEAREAESRGIIAALKEHFMLGWMSVESRAFDYNDKLGSLLFEQTNGLWHSDKALSYLDQESQQAIQSSWEELLEGKATNHLLKLTSPSSGTRWVQTTMAPIQDGTGHIRRIMMIGHDVSKLKEREEEIRLVNERLSEALKHAERQKDILDQNRQVITASKNRLMHYTDVLMRLSKSDQLHAGNLEPTVNWLLKAAAVELRASRVSLWRMKGDRLNKISLYNLHNGDYEQGGSLMVNDFPSYFAALAEEKIIVADDVFAHHAMKDFEESYLKPLKIHSMLDIPLHYKGEMWGVICCEQQISKRFWTPEDVYFIRSMADLLIMALNAKERREQEIYIAEQNQHIQAQNEELKSQAEEIIRINESLEERVRERTEALQRQNEQLAEYAFINAHLLRGPLCRILGLANVLAMSLTSDQETELLDMLKRSTDELDRIVFKITSMLAEGKHFERGDIVDRR